MTTPMLKYNRALDCLALAAQAFTRNGDEVLAARLFAKAMSQPDVEAAINTIEATNRVAFARLEAARTEAKAKKTQAAKAPVPLTQKKTAAKRVQAAEEMGEESEFPVADEEHVEADFDADPLEDVEEEGEEPEEEHEEPVVAGRRMAEVLSKMKSRRDGK